MNFTDTYTAFQIGMVFGFFLGVGLLFVSGLIAYRWAMTRNLVTAAQAIADSALRAAEIEISERRLRETQARLGELLSQLAAAEPEGAVRQEGGAR
jgi:Tfp pilus assembly protein PilX